MELGEYLPIAFMFLLAAGFVAVSLGASYLLSPKRPTPEKLAPYECGIVPEVEPVQRFPVKFYLVAMLFVIFDVEIIFLCLGLPFHRTRLVRSGSDRDLHPSGARDAGVCVASWGTRLEHPSTCSLPGAGGTGERAA